MTHIRLLEQAGVDWGVYRARPESSIMDQHRPVRCSAAGDQGKTTNTIAARHVPGWRRPLRRIGFRQRRECGGGQTLSRGSSERRRRLGNPNVLPGTKGTALGQAEVGGDALRRGCPATNAKRGGRQCDRTMVSVDMGKILRDWAGNWLCHETDDRAWAGGKAHQLHARAPGVGGHLPGRWHSFRCKVHRRDPQVPEDMLKDVPMAGHIITRAQAATKPLGMIELMASTP